MSKLEFVSIGSGTLPHVGPNCPTISGQFPDNKYPLVENSYHLRTRQGTSVVLLNPEDLSAHIGFRVQSITVNTSPIALPAVPLECRRNLTIHNAGPGILYLGASNVAASFGFPLMLNEKIAIDCQGHGGMVIYGISDSTCDVRILELA